MPASPKYPVYIISKGRWDSRLTSKAFEKLGVPYRIVIEPQEHAQYAAVIDPAKILVLPFSDPGSSIPARNWIWKHSITEGAARHWIVDDNIRMFRRFNRNLKVPVSSGAIFCAMEAFVDRYENVPMAGPNYCSLVKRRFIRAPFIANTRIYSCILLSNSPRYKFRWRGRYNEDTDLSLRYLKAGFCTILFNAFLAEKTATMKMKGGNTDTLYRQDAHFDGRLEMARSLQRQHPDVTTITHKFGHWQHSVDYRPFRQNKLIRKPDAEIGRQRINNFGMQLVKPRRKGD
jgi:hypothetical protein